jgi:hypothetical protein
MTEMYFYKEVKVSMIIGTTSISITGKSSSQSGPEVKMLLHWEDLQQVVKAVYEAQEAHMERLCKDREELKYRVARLEGIEEGDEYLVRTESDLDP